MKELEYPIEYRLSVRADAEELFYSLALVGNKKNRIVLERVVEQILLSQLNQQISQFQQSIKVADYQIARIKQETKYRLIKSFNNGIISGYNARKIYYNEKIKQLENRKLELQKL